MRYGLHSSLFFTVLGMWFHLVRLTCMVVLIGLWHRLTLWVCLSLFLLRGVARPDHRLGSISQYRRDLCQGLCQGHRGASLAKRPHLESGNEAHLSGKKSAGGSVSTSSAGTRRKRDVGVGSLDVPESLASSASSSSTSAAFHVGMLFKFFDQLRSITSSRFVLNMVQGHHLQLRSHPSLPCSITSGNLMSRQLQLIITLFRRRLISFLLSEQLNPLLVVLVSILACLWFLSILGASDPYLT